MIHHHIDLGMVLRGTVCALYSNLVTRPTGAAVRSEIERAIAEVGGRTVTVIDFAEVTLLDFSCADEIVAKLMLRYCAPCASAEEAAARGLAEGYFVFRGLGDRHLDAVEAVLERHRLTIVAVIDGQPHLVGEVAPEERRAWEALLRCAPADAARLAGELARDRTPVGADSLADDRAPADRTPDVAALLDQLARRRLIIPLVGPAGARWIPVGLPEFLPGGSGGQASGRAA